MDKQGDLRDRLTETALQHVAFDDVTMIEAATACMGATAILLGALPQDIRTEQAAILSESLLLHANKRARELRRNFRPLPKAD